MRRMEFPETTRIGLLFVSLVCLSAVALFAQGPFGRITGRVVDSTGAVVPGASVHVKNIETNVAADVNSDSQGNYEARNLISGQYEVAVEAPGFKRYQRGPIEVRVGDVLTVNIGLELGVVTDSIMVTAETPLLEAASASLSQVIDRRSLVDLSIPNSNVTYLIQLAAGIVQKSSPLANWGLGDTSTMSNFSTTGSGAQTSEFTVDGIPNMLSNTEPDNHLLMPEIMQEFRVQTAAFDASAGHFTGSQVNMVIKSGTNQFHGSLNYQYYGRPLMAHPFFVNRQIYDPTTGPITQAKINAAFGPQRDNRYRAMVSGPVYIPKLYDGRNRTFFTYGYDDSGKYVGLASAQTVPTAAERNGDFSALLALGSQYQIYDPATIAPVANGRFSRQPLPGNIIPPSRLDPIAQRLVGYYPLPNAAGTVDGLTNYRSSPLNKSTRKQHTGRIDHVINSKQHLFLSVMRSTEDTWTSPFPSNDKGDLLSAAVDHTSIAITVDDAIVLRPNLVLDLRYGVHRHGEFGLPGSLGFDLKALGLPASLVSQLNPSFTTLPLLTIDSFTTIGGNGGNTTPSIYQSTFHIFLAISRTTTAITACVAARSFAFTS